MFVSHPAFRGGHRSISLCKLGAAALKVKRAIEEDSRNAREVVFTIQ
jgi:hypothetical protein